MSAEQKPFRTSVAEVPLVEGLTEEEGWVEMQVQFLVNEANAGTDQLTFGRTVMPPGARHDRHLHTECDEFLLVMTGSGDIYTDDGREPAKAGDVVFTPAGHWHGFDNTGEEDALLIWGWRGAGSLESSGYRVPEDGYDPAA